MAVFRVERTQNYTVMSNYHLRDKTISFKAKGLLSLMLSLPEDWDYTLAGLTRISLEGKDAIRAAVVELEKAGYVTRSRVRNEKGHLQGTEYVIRERPVFSAQPALEEPASENPTLEDTTQLNRACFVTSNCLEDKQYGMKYGRIGARELGKSKEKACTYRGRSGCIRTTVSFGWKISSFHMGNWTQKTIG